MEFIKVTSQSEWDGHVSRQQRSSFLQSWFWGDVASKDGFEVSRIGIMDNGKFVAGANLIRKPLIAGYGYYYCPLFPVIGESGEETGIVRRLVEYIKRSDKDRIVFLRFEPTRGISVANSRLVKTIDIQPRQTRILNLADTEEDLLKSMHQKTRYNIRLAEKKGVSVETGGSDNAEVFWRLLKATAARDNFRTHGYKHYFNLLEAGTPGIKLLIARFNREPIAAVILAEYGDTVTYLHGAALNTWRHLMAPYLLQWTAIRQARGRGYRYYDFYGIDEQRWPGVTRFKSGFGGRIASCPGTYDLVLMPQFYRLYRVLRVLRRNT
jgi:peptidoglycan pentaglycine glycine transferase (the first glycine)